MSTYITALVAGEYHEVLDTYEGKHGDIPLGHYCRQSLVEHLDVEELVKLTRQGFEFFEDAFDYPYPFGKYDQLYVPEYNMGAMENAGCVTLRDEYLPRSRQDGAFYEFRASVILHEMAHMWFGDLVTMKWWDDLWLNESFAEWACYHAAVEATEFTESWTGFTNARKNWAYRQDQLPSTHPIAADNVDLRAVEVNFDGITYAKGASVLKQLVAWVGLDNFLTGLQGYFKDFAFGNSEFTDLLAALEKASGRELDTWAQEWLQTVRRQHAGARVRARRRRRLHLVRGPPDRAPPTTRRCAGTGSASACTTSATATWSGVPPSRSTSRATSPRSRELVGEKQPDLLLLNEGDLAYAKIRLDERSLATVDRRPRHARRLARPGAVLGRGVGHDPRRRDERHRLRRRSCSARSAARPTRSASAGSPATAPRRSTPTPPRRTGPRSRRPGSRACASCSTRPSRAATTSCRSRVPTPPPRTATRRCRRSRACSTARCPSTGSPSTPTCAGTC